MIMQLTGKTLVASSLMASIALVSCQQKATCKYKPEPIFSKDLPHITQYNFEKEGSQSLESIMLDRGILLEIGQEVCGNTFQEYRFTVQGDYSTQPDSFWMKEASRQFVFLSSFSPKQAPLKDWGDIIEQRRSEMSLGQDREVQQGIFVKVDRILSPEQATLMVTFSQKSE
ncbi:MAG: hypothetical protein JNN28_21905 [Saprospiraceae bacterium]|nr:hypothetical protein [Saprospiraceae bacterium]